MSIKNKNSQAAVKKLKLTEFRQLVRKLIREEAGRYSLNFGWGQKNAEHPDVPWMQKSPEYALHNNKEVFRKFVSDMLGFDPAKSTTDNETEEEKRAKKNL